MRKVPCRRQGRLLAFLLSSGASTLGKPLRKDCNRNSKIRTSTDKEASLYILSNGFKTTLRVALLASAAIAASGCTATTRSLVGVAEASQEGPGSVHSNPYGEVNDNGTIIPAVDTSKTNPRYLRQIVDYQTDEPVGTIIVDPQNRFLYLVMEGGKAMRYGVGVAKAGLEFEGEAIIERKAAWPGWAPTADMIKREPERYGPYANGLEGGLHNPLGARALYLYKDGKDTLYRIHGTNEPWSIGKAVSSGCIRLMNQDIIDLSKRVRKGARVVGLGAKQKGES